MKKRPFFLWEFLLFGLAASLLAQSSRQATFEVASVRAAARGGNRVEVRTAIVTATGATIAACIKWAFGVPDAGISGANSAIAGLLRSDRYDIVARAPGPVPESQLKLMLQALLADRFDLEFHRQSREVRVYALVVEKNGAKFKEAQGDGESRLEARSRLMRQWKWTTMKQFADSLADAMEAPVLDETGLPARYDLALDLTPYLPANGERPDIAAMMVTAIREQLGLRMEARRKPVDVMVIDRVSKPSAN